MRRTMHDLTDKTGSKRYGLADRTTTGDVLEPQQHDAVPASTDGAVAPKVQPEPDKPAVGGWSVQNIPFAITAVVAACLALALVLVLTLGGSSNADDAAAAERVAQNYTVTVVFQLSDSDSARAGCIGDGGYSDIGPGTPVRLTNQSSEVLAAASLGPGKKSGGSTCTWTVTLDDVPPGERFYSVEVASRGQITQSDSELQDSNYTFELSLG